MTRQSLFNRPWPELLTHRAVNSWGIGQFASMTRMTSSNRMPFVATAFPE